MKTTMTDEEIIKVLKCCLNADSLFECYECDYYGKEHCLNSMIIDVLDLINHQKAKIERLNKQLVFEIESAYDRGMKTAIKELAERLKEHREIVGYDRDFDADIYGLHIRIDIDEFDNLVKEMVGE